ncbi:MAG: hypothetical protein WCQ82_08495 [Bacteroidaceae bacterium]
MNTKEYLKPTTEVIELAAQQIIAASISTDAVQDEDDTATRAPRRPLFKN